MVGCLIHRLLVVLIGLIVDDVEELELVDPLGGGDDAEPVTELHLLQELLGPVHPTLVSVLSCPVVWDPGWVPDGRNGVPYRYLR